MATFRTILLDPVSWDMLIDINGNIAVAEPPYAIAQDVASACSTFKGELLYDVDTGIPYFQDVLGQNIPLSIYGGYLEQAALSVSGVVSAQADLIINSDRSISGTVNFIDENGASNNVQF